MREAARQKLRELGKQRWAESSPEQRARWLSGSAAATAQRYPHRAALHADIMARIESGEIAKQDCPRCLGPGRVELLFDDEATTVRVIGWRCYPCRKIR
jgi:hypothetical protein